jgi:hypothetical protein
MDSSFLWGWILPNAFIARRAWSAALRLPALSTCSSARIRYCKAAWDAWKALSADRSKAVKARSFVTEGLTN